MLVSVSFSIYNACMYLEYNPNPSGKRVGDCVIRAIAKVTGRSWEHIYIGLFLKGLKMHDMPSSNGVWASYLRDLGYVSKPLPNHCPDCYTVAEFAIDNPNGSYILATGQHAVAVVHGDYYDAWDSGEEIPTYLFQREVDDGV